MTAKRVKPKRTIAQVIESATKRACIALEEESTGHLHDGWSGKAFATWITPAIIAAVKRYLATLTIAHKTKRRKK
jgi:hypothetical protein